MKFQKINKVSTKKLWNLKKSFVNAKRESIEDLKTEKELGKTMLRTQIGKFLRKDEKMKKMFESKESNQDTIQTISENLQTINKLQNQAKKIQNLKNNKKLTPTEYGQKFFENNYLKELMEFKKLDYAGGNYNTEISNILDKYQNDDFTVRKVFEPKPK